MIDKGIIKEGLIVRLPSNTRSLCGTRIGLLVVVVEEVRENTALIYYPPTGSYFEIVHFEND